MKRSLIIILAMVFLILTGCAPDSSLSSNITLEKNNSRMQAVISKNCNYIYHMLAVSQCGYVNEYGKTYQALHSEKDLQTLKKYESYLTVEGGKHQGELYSLCVVLPATLDDSVSVATYFQALADLFATGEMERNFDTYQEIYKQSFSSVSEINMDSFQQFYKFNEPLKNEIAEVADVMSRNYDIYADQVWDASLAELTVIAKELNQDFSSHDYISKWEELLGCKYGQDAFNAVLCNSMENGANCINISANQDVFYHSGETASTVKLINHEFGIYLLMDALADTKAFQDNAYYELTEALAEYYNTVVTGGHSDWDWGTEYIDFYQQLQDSEPEMTAKELFLRAVERFLPDLEK